MPNFCNNCKSLLLHQITHNSFHMFCPMCKKLFEPDASSTCLMDESTKSGKISNNAMILRFLTEDDPAGLTVSHVCIKCKHGVCRQTNNGIGNIIMACVACKTVQRMSLTGPS